MKVTNRPSGTIRTFDASRAGIKVANDLVKLDANKDGVLTKAELTAGEKRLRMDGAERRVISRILANSIQERGGVSEWSATIASVYAGGKLTGLDTHNRGVVNARDLGKITAPANEGPHGIDQVEKRLAPDFFEYVQAEERAGKKF